jgi:lipopolysaccharide transport system permease protein
MNGLAILLSPNRNWAALTSVGALAWKHRHLLTALVVRELKDANVRSVMGSFWIVGAPLLTMLVYVFAFTLIFRVRMGLGDGPLDYVGFVLVGLAVWISLQEAASRASGAVLNNANLVKQIVFPVELLPMKTALAAQVTTLVTLAVASGACTAAGSLTLWSVLLLPVAVIILLALSIGLSFFLSALAVFMPDVRNLVQLFFGLGLFLHPILYPPDAPPHAVAWAFEFSPFSHVIWTFRDALFEGALTRPHSWAIAAAFALIFYVVGFRFFRMLKPTFGNAL